MDINRLRYFVAVVEAEGISAAAQKINISQPSLSIMIKKLEEELGVQLFIRDKKRLILTDAGKLLYEKSKPIISSVDRMLVEMDEASNGIHGEIKVGCSTAANLIIIPRMVEILQKTTPNVTLRVIEGNTKFIADQLLSNQIDVAIVRTKFSDDHFDIHPIVTEPIVACLHKDHPFVKRKTLKLKDFAEENFLLNTTTTGSGLSDYILKMCEQEGFTPKVTYWGNQGLPMMILASKGVGITFLPKSFELLPFYDEKPAFKEIDTPKLQSNLELITLKNKVKSAATHQFIHHVVQLSKELNF